MLGNRASKNRSWSPLSRTPKIYLGREEPRSSGRTKKCLCGRTGARPRQTRRGQGTWNRAGQARGAGLRHVGRTAWRGSCGLAWELRLRLPVQRSRRTGRPPSDVRGTAGQALFPKGWPSGRTSALPTGPERTSVGFPDRTCPVAVRGRRGSSTCYWASGLLTCVLETRRSREVAAGRTVFH